MSIKKKGDVSNKSMALLERITGKKLTLGNFLWSIREGEEMSQVNFAKSLGISRQYLCDIEHGRRIVSAKAAAEFADKLGYSALHFVKLAIHDELYKSGLNFDVQITEHRDAA